MMASTAIRCIAILVAFSVSVEGSNILAIFPFPSKSHFIMMEELAKGLAAKGHQITVVGHFPQKKPIPNYTDISLEGTARQIVNNISLEFIFARWRPPLQVLDYIWREAGLEHCELAYGSRVMQKLLKSSEKFDLLIAELWGSDCFLPLANVLDVPHISLITTMEVPWSLGRYGVSVNPSYQVHHFLHYPPGRLTFWQRFVNAVFVAYMNVGYYILSELPSDKIVKKYLGPSVPHLTEVVKNSSLVLLNTHFSIVGPRPLLPNVVEVGGLHIPPSKPLPPDLKTLLDEAKHGVVLFSLGSLIRPDTLDSSILDTFVEEFGRLQQIVVWKFNGTIANKPDNLKIFKWIPQRDILAHPNVKLFITHGGLMGTQEAITAGVPMLGIPFFADQRFNIGNYQKKGFAIKVELEEISRDTVRLAIHELLHNPEYAKKAKHYSRLFLDRPQNALETAIYWTEYVIRHKGAPHIKSEAAHLSFVEYHLLDVLAFSVALLLLFAYLTYFTYRKFIACLFGSDRHGNKQKKE